MDRFASDWELEMDPVSFPMAMTGFVFGLIAFTQVASASKKIKELEQRLNALEGDEGS